MSYYDVKITGARIKTLRVVNGMTQEQLADQLYINDRHLRKIEKGENGASLDLLVEIAAFFDVSLDFLILGKEQQSDREKRLRDKIRELQLLLMSLEDELS